MKFPSYGLVYDYSLEDGGVSRKHSKDDDDEDHHTGEVRGQILCLNGKRTHLTWREREETSAKFQTTHVEVVFCFYFAEYCVEEHLCGT